jgi:hypothetical protein
MQFCSEKNINLVRFKISSRVFVQNGAAFVAV